MYLIEHSEKGVLDSFVNAPSAIRGFMELDPEDQDKCSITDTETGQVVKGPGRTPVPQPRK